jgi:hypothetical protein
MQSNASSLPNVLRVSARDRLFVSRIQSLLQRLAWNRAERPFVKLEGAQIHSQLDAVFLIDFGRYSP